MNFDQFWAYSEKNSNIANVTDTSFPKKISMKLFVFLQNHPFKVMNFCMSLLNLSFWSDDAILFLKNHHFEVSHFIIVHFEAKKQLYRLKTPNDEDQ